MGDNWWRWPLLSCAFNSGTTEVSYARQPWGSPRASQACPADFRAICTLYASAESCATRTGGAYRAGGVRPVGA
jgi:hypothetical protein